MSETQEQDGQSQEYSWRPRFLEETEQYSLYIGTNAGGRIWTSIKQAEKSIKIVSPYLGEKFIDILRERHIKGVRDISLIACVSDEGLYKQAEPLKKLISRERPKDVSGDVFEPLFNNTVFFRGEFIHEKLYIIDSQAAFVGSVNFTENGMEKKHETCLMIKTPAVVVKMEEYFQKLINANLRKWDVAELGRRLYTAKVKQ